MFSDVKLPLICDTQGKKNEVLLRHFTQEELCNMEVRGKRSGNKQPRFRSPLLHLLAG